jgi:hypothetical protein
MTSMSTRLPWRSGLQLALILAFPLSMGVPDMTAAQSGAVATLFWCPNKPGSELQVRPGPGCHPLVEEKKDEQSTDKQDGKSGRKIQEFPTLKTDQIESAVSEYLKEYRSFMACCAAAPDLETAAALEDRASDLIRQTATQLGASIYMSRNQGLIVPVAQARDELRALQRKFGRINASKEKLELLDYEDAGKERRRIQEMEESAGREFSPKRDPSRAPTGADIGGSSPTGPAVGAPAPTGTNIGKTAPTGTAIGSPPPPLGELVDTVPGTERNRDNTLTTTQPVRGGTVGPDIGNSSFNENARTGPALGDSSQNR